MWPDTTTTRSTQYSNAGDKPLLRRLIVLLRFKGSVLPALTGLCSFPFRIGLTSRWACLRSLCSHCVAVDNRVQRCLDKLF